MVSARGLRTGIVRALASGALAGWCGPASGQELRTLHVDALSMRVDRARVPLGDDVHLIIHARVRERVTALDELIVPDLGSIHVLGDERHVKRGPGGTDVDETLTLEPIQAGTFVLPGAFLDAVDARTGKRTRFSANPVRLAVGAADAGATDWPRRAGLLIAGALLATMGAVIFARTLARRRRVVPVVREATPPPASVPAAMDDGVREALRAYRRAPSLEALTTLRAALYAAAGSPRGATLRDALAATPDERLQTALRATDTAAFAPPGARGVAVEYAVASIAAWLE